MSSRICRAPVRARGIRRRRPWCRRGPSPYTRMPADAKRYASARPSSHVSPGRDAAPQGQEPSRCMRRDSDGSDGPTYSPFGQ